MPRFKYKARDHSGQIVMGYAESDTALLLKERLRERGIWLVKAHTVYTPWSIMGQSVRPLELAMYTKQMGVLLNAGVSLVSALNSLLEGASPNFRPVIYRIIDEIKAGRTYSSTLTLFPRIFSPFFIGMMEVGEASGLLGEMHERLTSHLEQNIDLRKKMVTASIYPALVLIATMCSVSFILIYAFPKIADIYKKNQVELPMLTKVMIFLSDFLLHQWYIPLIAVISLLVAVFGFQIHRKKPFKQWLDRLMLWIPFYSGFYRQIMLARFSNNLSLLLNSGVTLLRGLEIIKNLMDNTVIKGFFDLSITSIQTGESFASYLRQNRFFPPLLVSLIHTGEESGALSEMMKKASEFYAKEVEEGVKQFTALLEPVLIVFASGTVFLVLLAFYIPLFRMFKVMMHH